MWIRKIWTNHTHRELFRLAIPVIGTSFLSMAYNLINVIFVGHLGSNAVAAVGSAGFFIHLSWGISTLLTVGAGIKVAHAKGRQNDLLSCSYVRSGIQTVFFVALAYYLLLLIAGNDLIKTVGLNEPKLESTATNYLLWIGLSIPFSFQNLFLTSVFIGNGDSRTSFKINGVAFIMNLLLDPILIFMLELGINGAAFSTVISQSLATALFYKKINQTPSLNPANGKYKPSLLKKMLKLGISTAIQRISFTIIAIVMARIISNWGPTAIAVQKVGVQIEAISYMTAGGFMSAISALSGKAFGARDYKLQWKFFISGILLALSIGLVSSIVLIGFPETLFSIFLADSTSLTMGKEYLIIIGFSQIFMCLELMTTGAFWGWGRTNIPAIVSTSLTLLRIPLALLFINFWCQSLSSVWWSISLSSIAKGILLVTLFILLFKTLLNNQKTP